MEPKKQRSPKTIWRILLLIGIPVVLFVVMSSLLLPGYGDEEKKVYSDYIAYFEKNSSHYPSTKCFLTVDDFNVRAKKLYEDLGYQCVGTLPDFYKAGITSYIMMKATTR